jgi:hypothetical protein
VPDKDRVTPFYLDDVGDDLNLFVVPVPSHGLQLSHKDRETPFYLDDVGDDLPPLVFCSQSWSATPPQG